MKKETKATAVDVRTITGSLRLRVFKTGDLRGLRVQFIEACVPSAKGEREVSLPLLGPDADAIAELVSGGDTPSLQKASASLYKIVDGVIAFDAMRLTLTVDNKVYVIAERTANGDFANAGKSNLLN